MLVLTVHLPDLLQAPRLDQLNQVPLEALLQQQRLAAQPVVLREPQQESLQQAAQLELFPLHKAQLT